MLVLFLLLKVFIYFLITYEPRFQRSSEIEMTARKAFLKELNWIFIKLKSRSEYYMRHIVPTLCRSNTDLFASYFVFLCLWKEVNKSTVTYFSHLKLLFKYLYSNKKSKYRVYRTENNLLIYIHENFKQKIF